MNIADYKAFWEVNTMTEAWQKIATADKEDPEHTRQTAQVILDQIPTTPDGCALEVGAGVGRLMREMHARFDFVWGVDMSESMVDFSDWYLKYYPRCIVKLGDGHRIPMSSNAIDFVYSYITFQHIPTLEIVRENIAEIFRVLKPGGFCRVQTIKGWPCGDEFKGMHGHYFEHEEDFRQEFERAGFKAKVTLGEIHPSAIWVTAQKPKETS